MKTPLVLFPVLFACAGVAAQGSEATPEKNWQDHCVKCHGRDGAGKTVMGAKLHVIDFTQHAAQRTFSDEEAFLSITKGRTNVHGKPAESISEAEARALVKYVRSLEK